MATVMTMTIDDSEIIRTLGNETKYTYSDLIRQLQDNESLGAVASSADQLKNTVELFAFGNYSHYKKYQNQFIKLDNNLLLKLIKLTILSMVQDYEGSSILFDEMDEKYLISQAVEDYCDSSDEPVCHLLESTFFSMIDDNLIQIRLDLAKDRINVNKALVLRDCYDPSDIPLVVLREEDIPKNAGTSYAKLDKWLEQIKAVKKQRV